VAYQKDWRDEEEQTGAAANPAKQNTSGVIDGQTQANADTTSGAPAPAPSNQGTGSGFVNLQAYMDNNKGEGGRMVNDATKGLVGDVGAFKDTAASTVADQTKAMQAATGGGSKLSALKNGLTTDPTANIGAARDFVNSTAYTGPTAGEASAGLAAQQKDLASKLGAVSGDSVVDSLKSTTGSPYTSGFGYLDKFLTGDTSGKQAIDAVHGKAADVNTAADAAKAQLGTSEAAARNQLATNKAWIVNQAKATEAKIRDAAQKRADAMNSGMNLTNLDASKASLGDGISDKDKSDLEALNQLTRSGPLNFGKTFNAGHAAPPPPLFSEDTGFVSGTGHTSDVPGGVAGGGWDVYKTGKNDAHGIAEDVTAFGNTPSMANFKKIHQDVANMPGDTFNKTNEGITNNVPGLKYAPPPNAPTTDDPIVHLPPPPPQPPGWSPPKVGVPAPALKRKPPKMHF
jgi:hypothetical protein